MTAPAPHTTTTSALLSTQNALLQTLTSFLTVSLHQILYLRRLYPPVSFISTRAYNYPVRQNRHPAVCDWINSAIAAVRDQLEKNTISKIAVCIFNCADNQVLERWTFDLGGGRNGLPLVEPRERDTPFESYIKKEDGNGVEENLLPHAMNLIDLESQFRALLSRLNTSAARLSPLPSSDPISGQTHEYSFTMTMEVKDSADRPVGVGRNSKEERKWIAAEPESFSSSALDDEIDDEHDANAEGGEKKAKSKKTPVGKTFPVRRLEAGELKMEVWVEESRAKFELQQHYGRSGSYGGGSGRSMS